MLGHCRGCLSRYGFQSKNSHVFLCQNVSNFVQSSLVFQTVFCLTASPPFTKRSKLREKTRASGSRDVSRLPQIETLLAGYVHTYDNFLLRVEEGGDENGERTRSSRSFPSPTPTSQDLARRLISLQWPISFFFCHRSCGVCLSAFVCFRRGLFQFGARVHRERSTRKGK